MPPPHVHPITRLAACAVLATSALVSCAPASKEKMSGAKDDTQPPPAANPGNQLRVLTWADYFSPEVCEEFTRKTGISIEWHYFENLGEMNGLLKSKPDGFDVLILDDMSLGELIETRMLRALDPDKIPNSANIDPKYLNRHFDPHNKFSIPYMWGTTMVAYRKDRITPPANSWNFLWDERLRGKVIMLNERQDVYAATLLSLGLPMASEDAGHLDRCTRKLKEQVQRLDARFTDLESAKESITNGSAWAVLTYSGDAAVLKEADSNIAYYIPTEGAPLWLDSFSIPREAPNPDAAHLFINFMSEATAAAANANFLSYATANMAAKPFLNEDLVNDPTIYPSPEVLANCDFIPKPGTSRDTVTNRGMKEIFDLIHTRELAASARSDAPPATNESMVTAPAPPPAE